MANKLTIIGALLMVAGCKHHEPRYSETTYSPNYGYAGTSTYSGSSTTSGTTTGSVGDQALSDQIQQTLKSDPTLASIAPQIQISAQSGTVTLSGNVSSEQEKQKIESMVKSTTGVVNVNNQLQVGLQPTSDRPGQRLYHENKTDSITPDAGTAAPQSSTATPPSATSQTSQNDLTSAQTAPSTAATGATSASNQSSATTPSPTPSQEPTPTSDRPESRIYSTNQTTSGQSSDVFSASVQGTTEADQSLGRRIIQELRTDTSLAATLPMIKIAVDSGKLTITGTVKTDDEKQKIESAAKRVTGVNTVDNQLQVSTNPAATETPK